MLDWANAGTFGCEKCAAMRRAFMDATKEWASNPTTKPRPGTTEFIAYVKEKTERYLEGGSPPESGQDSPGRP